MESTAKTSKLQFLLAELKPKGKIFTPFNIISGAVILAALVILVFRFMRGLGWVVDADQEHPWGLWINFNVITGVAFAGGAYVLTFMYYILGLEQYRPIVRATVLYGFLAYVFYAGALLLDLGRPWHIVNPIIGNSFGVSAVLFLVAWHFLLYMGSLFLEFSPTIAEWINARKLYHKLEAITLGVVIFGITLSTLHQSALGALFLMAKPKIHPLWYSEFLPLMFFISSIFAGLSLVIIIESINQKVFAKEMSPVHKKSHRGIIFKLGRVCGMTMFVYFFMSLLLFIHGKNIVYLNTGWGYWYLFEIVILTLLPAVLFYMAYQSSNRRVLLAASGMTVLGIILNRLNISMIAFHWQEAGIHFPSWKEVIVSLAVIFVQIWVYRWIVRRMPVYNEKISFLLYRNKTQTKTRKTKKTEPWKVLPE